MTILPARETNRLSRRSWKPNVQEKHLFSYILDRPIRVKVTSHALRPHFCFGYSLINTRNPDEHLLLYTRKSTLTSD
ncbi:hypothetical protein E1A91_D06G126400v1 [Gossypium mustelinum]|uniref:Uncharacterized protein n=1 Tax=Gossypium mustelinum TaxID=34275 RepID=A0A5D2UHF6_GOSMU|nr:hypothetical protein E1A91_D06G126400v1 [Gossypium mustelinum]